MFHLAWKTLYRTATLKPHGPDQNKSFLTTPYVSYTLYVLKKTYTAIKFVAWQQRFVSGSGGGSSSGSGTFLN